MTGSNEQEAVMVRYLLGQSTEEERAQVEERYFSDGAYFDRLLALESCLIDDFVIGRMPAEQRDSFKKSFSGRQDDIAFSRALVWAATKKQVDRGAPESKRRFHAPARLPFDRTRFFRLAPLLASVVLLVIVSLALWLKTQSLQKRLSETENQLTAAKKEKEASDQELIKARSQRESSDKELEVEASKGIDAGGPPQKNDPSESPKESSAVKIVTLDATFISRGATGAIMEVRVDENVRQLRFLVPVKRYRNFDSYKISIKPVDQPGLFERESLKPHPTSRQLVVTVAAANLNPGDYVIRLYGERAGLPPTDLQEFTLRIAR